MANVWDIYENMNEVVYVSDIDTYEIVYMNRKAMELYDVKSMDDIIGKKCYQVFQHNSTPCAVCNNHKLATGHYEEWHYFSPILEGNFKLKDTLVEVDGKRYRIEMAIELGYHGAECDGTRKYLNNDAIINEALRMSMTTEDPDRSIDILIEYMGKSLMAERMYIFEDKDGTVFDNTYEWCAIGVSPEKNNLQNVPWEDARIWLDRFQKNKNIIIKNLEDTKEEDPVIYDYLKPQNIQSLVVSALTYKEKVIGFVGVDNPPEIFLENISTLFMIVSHFIVALLRRRDLFKRLESLSYHDQMTGLGNRYAMEDYINALDHNKSLGIINCDVMGLKKINDALGHPAGDELLIRAANSLRKVFPEENLFRIGGDEFLVLYSGVSDEEFKLKTEQLREIMKKDYATMAVGSLWCADVSHNINSLLADADALMYADKRRYYQIL
jgi:diguanylate cyclase (GGDEF)-like protein